jgi:hypothetical protein
MDYDNNYIDEQSERLSALGQDPVDLFDDEEDETQNKPKKKRLTQSDRLRMMLFKEREEKNKIIEEFNRTNEDLSNKIKTLAEYGKQIEKDKHEIEKEHFGLLEETYVDRKKILKKIGQEDEVEEYEKKINKIRTIQDILEQERNSVFEQVEPEVVKYDIDNRPIPDIKDIENEELYTKFLKKHPELNMYSESFNKESFDKANELSNELTQEYIENGRKDKLNSPEFLADLHLRLKNNSNDYSEKSSPSYSPSLQGAPNYKSGGNSRDKLTPSERELMETAKYSIKNFNEDEYVKFVLSKRGRK